MCHILYRGAANWRCPSARLVPLQPRPYTIRSLVPQTKTVALRQVVSVTGRSLTVRAGRGRSLSDSIGITSQLAVAHRATLEALIFFNANQHRVRSGIQKSIEIYGVPEIYEQDGLLGIRVGNVMELQTLFAVSTSGRPLGVAVFVRLPHERYVVLHLVVEPRSRSPMETNTPVLLRLMHAIRSAARRTRARYCIELVYKPRLTEQRHAVRANV